jgi:hypothetical protein
MGFGIILVILFIIPSIRLPVRIPRDKGINIRFIKYSLMSSMRRASILAIIAIVLVLMVLLAGCGQRVPTRNTTSKNPWGNTTPKKTAGPAPKTIVVPTTTSPFVEVTLIPERTVTVTPDITYRSPPPVANATANLTLLDKKTLVLSWNRTAYNYELEDPPLLIKYTLTVPNITKTRVITDPVSGGDRTVSITYPNPAAIFEVTVRDLETNQVLARDGYGGQYDVSYSKQVWVRHPGTYYIEFFGRLVTAKVEFWGQKAEI